MVWLQSEVALLINEVIITTLFLVVSQSNKKSDFFSPKFWLFSNDPIYTKYFLKAILKTYKWFDQTTKPWVLTIKEEVTLPLS